MSMYNMMFGNNPASEVILATLGLSLTDVPRFRDCLIAEGEIVVYTRMGGGNSECWEDSPVESCTCNFCKGVLKNMEGHPNYLRGVDDEFDCTYRTFYFSFPEKYREELEIMDSDVEWDPGEKWSELFEALKTAGKRVN